jgi:FkbM family methyltransferase
MSVSKAERKAALDLYPYFSKSPVIFDVGSNKGQWADIFVRNAAEVHLFEPNQILLHYTMAKYDNLLNVYYNAEAISDKTQWLEMNIFGNQYNGLSSALKNPKWRDLPQDSVEVSATSLDEYTGGEKDIDFLKIDVEGYEMFVLKGASALLNGKRIKFIQVENAEHIHLSGYTFDDVIKFLEQYGYSPIQTDDTENVIFAMDGIFTQDWNTEFKRNTQGITCNFALEIGAFEGLTTRYICDNMLKPGGRIICIDPLTDEYLPGHPDNHMFVGQHERFVRNTKGYPVELIRKTSRKAFPQLMDYRFDFIYIDGDHTENEVYNDGFHAIQIIADGGHILFDDYEWREETKRGIDRIIALIKGTEFEVIHKGYQVLIRKNKPE